MLRFRPLRILFLVALGLASSVGLAGSGMAALTNTAQLDNGTCGRNLQLGSDKTASSSPTPSFLIAGDGGLSSYVAFVDGVPLGTFFSDGFANVCVYTSTRLADGPHVLTATELLPHPTWTITPFHFTVDTVPPAQPSTPTISGYSDSGLLGDHITMYRNVNFSGFADPGVTVQLYSGVSLLGGAKADAAGFWSATTSTLADGNYIFTAAALDQAGNKSMLSLSCPLTIDSTAPTGALTSPPAGATVSGTIQLAATAADQVGIWKVDFKVDGVTKGTATGPPYNYSWSSQQVANGAHTVTALISDYAGNTVSSSAAVNVQNNGSATTPTAPSLNSATAGNASITLNWTAPTSDGGSPITGYRVYRSNTSGAETLLTTLGTATSYTNTGLTNGSTYYYKITALNALGESPLSSERWAIPSGTPNAPALNIPTSGNATVTLTWTTPNGNGSTVTGYRVYRSTSSGTETLYTTIGALNSYTDTNLTNGTTYYYKLTALNALGESPLSGERFATPATTPNAPTLNLPTAGNGSATLSWTAPSGNGSSLTGYRVYRSTSSGTETLLTTLGVVNGYTDTAVSNGTTYFYKVSALNALGESGLSNERFATPNAAPTAPGAPTLNAPSAGNGSVGLNWTTPANNGSALTGYRVYRSTTSGAETALITLGLVNSWTDTSVANGTTYYYKLTALNAVGESSLSNERSATPAAPAGLPGAPRLNTASPVANTVALSWSPPTSNGGSAVTGYRIYRSKTSGNETLLATVGPVTSYTDVIAVNGSATYYYVVSAVNGVGEGIASNELSANPVTPPEAPTLIAAVPGNGVTLTWNAPATDGGSPIAGYRVWRSTSSGTQTPIATIGAVTSYTDAGASPGSTYYYKVTAGNSIGESYPSNEMWATVALLTQDTTPPAKPGNLRTSVVGTSQIALDWQDSTDNIGVTGYRIYRDGFLVATRAQTYYLDSGMAPNSAHVYEVAAVDAAGNQSLPSSMLSTKTASVGTLTTGTLAGVVFRAGAPLDNAIASVLLTNGTLKTTTTNSRGVWKLSNLPPANYVVSITSIGLQPVNVSMKAASGQTLLSLVTLG